MYTNLNDFTFSQNSINTYKSCPLKFKYKYIDKVNWMKDDDGSREYYNNLKMGLEFHLICERYFSNIPTGIDKIQSNEKDKFEFWFEKIKKEIPYDQSKKYLTEYEVIYNLKGHRLQAKYDLVVLSNDSIHIWDWKTQLEKINSRYIDGKIQTILYMLLAKKAIAKIHKINLDYKDIKMTYFQPAFEDSKATVLYSEDRHKKYKDIIESYVEEILNGNFNTKNINHCKFCEFNKICNGKDINLDVLDGDEICQLDLF